MTDAEIDALEGRALDSAVARIVLEHCVVRSVSGYTYTESDAAGMPFHPLRAYHADWGAMDLVVAKMRKRGLYLTLIQAPIESGAWRATFVPGDSQMWGFGVDGPAAGARAALKAVREE